MYKYTNIEIMYKCKNIISLIIITNIFIFYVNINAILNRNYFVYN